MRFGGAVEGNLASANAALLAILLQLLADFHFKIHVELASRCQFFFDIVSTCDVINRRAVTRAQELVLQVLAHHKVVAATFREEVHPSGDFGITQERSASHRVVPISIDPSERKYGRETCFLKPPHCDAGTKRIRQPDQRTDLVPEIVLRTQPTDERLKTFRPTQLHLRPVAAGPRWPLNARFGNSGDGLIVLPI